MARSNTHQPITNNVNNLVIGIPQMRAKKKDGINLTLATADATSSPLSSSDSVGSLQQVALAADAQFKAHQSGYPKLDDAQILEQNSITMTVTTEEILSDTIKSYLREIARQVSGYAPSLYATEMRAEKYAGGGTSFYCNNAQLKPQMSISTQNDWLGVELVFESLLRSSYTNQALCYRLNYTSAARSRVNNQAVTVDVNSLCIGFAQVRMGTPTPKAAGAASVGTPRFHSGVNSDTAANVISASGTYSGTVSGGIVVQITDTKQQRLSSAATISAPGATPTFDLSTATGDNTLTFVVDATDTYTVTFTDSATLSIVTAVAEINAAGPGSPASIVEIDGSYYILLTAGTSVEVMNANTSLGYVVDGAVLTADVFRWIAEDGVVTSGVAITGGSQPLGSGISVTFTGVLGHSPLDTWVIPVVSASAKTSDPAASSVNSDYPFLSSSDSIGAVQAASLSVEASLKPHYSGYPQKKDAELLESATVTLDISIEEFSYADGALTSGQATALPDMLFDSAVSGRRYFAPFEFLVEGIEGDTMSFWIPNGEIVGNLDVSPSDDWGAIPFQVKGSVQSDSIFGSGASAPRIFSIHDEDLYAA